MKRLPLTVLVLLFVLTPAVSTATQNAPQLDADAAARFARLALACVHQEYPNKIAHVLQSDADAVPPRALTPAFFGCYDWHSAVHGHWLLARLARSFPQSPLAADARAALATSLTPEHIAGEVRYFEGPGRVSFERPYGLAWLLQLAAELREWDDPDARAWAAALAPLEQIVAARLRDWIPKLTHPIRIGEHAQTAFAFGLIADWARVADDRDTARVVRRASFRFYVDDRSCPLAYEPSGHDFLSPCLAEADLMRRFLRPVEFAAWLGAFLPTIPHDDPDVWMAPATVSDPEDPKLAHLDGLNLSRAWMLEGIVTGLPDADPRITPLVATARAHREAGLASVTGEHYEGGHWLGSFAMYLVSGRGGSQTISWGPFDIVFRDTDRATVERVVVPRAHQALADVTTFLGIDWDDPILIGISRQTTIPHQRGNAIFLPAARLANDGEGSEYGISVVHELTHVVAASAFRPDRFFDDGLAVYLQSKFGTASSFPDFGRDLHEETVAVAKEAGDFLPLAETEPTRQNTQSNLLRRLAYLQEGSFTRFLIERGGIEPYLRAYRGEDLMTVYGVDRSSLEAAWRAHITATDP